MDKWPDGQKQWKLLRNNEGFTLVRIIHNIYKTEWLPKDKKKLFHCLKSLNFSLLTLFIINPIRPGVLDPDSTPGGHKVPGFNLI